MDEDKAISLEDLDNELEEYTFTMEGGAEPEPEISDESINLATDSSNAEPEAEPEAEAEAETGPEPEAEPEAEAEPEPEAEAEAEAEAESVVESEGLLEFEEEQRGEFILDDNDFEMVEGTDDITIKEETVLPVYQVILGDDEQETDIFNELVKQLPERHRENNNELKRIQRQLDHYIQLKVTHGIMDAYNNITSARFFGNNFRPLKTQFLESRNFNDSLFVPIIDSKKLIYDVETIDKDGNMPYIIDESEIGSRNILMRNYTKIHEQSGISDKYRKTNSRLNYSYNNHTYEILMSMEDSEYTSQSSSGFYTDFLLDTEVYSNIMPENDIMYYTRDGFKTGTHEKKVLMGELGTNFEPPIKGVSANITGFLRRPGGLFIHNRYPMKPLSETIIDYSTENLNSNFPINNDLVEHIDLDIETGSKVKVCFIKEQYEAEGTVKSMDDDKLIVKSDSGADELELMRGDENVTIKHLVNNRNCFNKDLAVIKLPERNISKLEFSEILDDVLPNQAEIVHGLKQDLIDRDDDVVNYHEINELLSSYNLHYDHLTSDLRKVLGEIIETNNKSLIVKSRNNKMEYKRFLKSTIDSGKGKKTERIELLNRKLLEEFKDFYGEYPYYNSNIDSVKERFKWLISRKDQGTLLFKSVILKVYNIIYKQADSTSDKLRETFFNLKQKRDDLMGEIESRKDLLIKDGSAGMCPSKRIVKIYHSNEDMEMDNNRETFADSNLESKLQSDNKVKPGDLCVLDENGEKKMFVRSEVGENHMWILDEDKNADSLIKDNMDYCNFQGKLLSDIDNSIYRDSSRCKFTEDLDACVDIDLHKMITEHNILSERVEEKERILLIIKDSTSILDRLEKMVGELKKNLRLNEKLNKKIYLQRDTEAAEIKENEDAREHQDLYNKIDRYLTKINTLPDEKMYPLLTSLITKYGREADTAVGETDKNVYCVAGSKVLTCKHHVHMAKYFENPKESEGVLTYVKDNFCVDGGDQYYCLNCGQAVYIADYETVEGFQSTGAYQTSTEVMTPDEEEEMEQRVNETVDSINAYLQADSDNNPDLDIIVKLFSVFQKATGLKVTEADEKLILSMTLELNRENIRDKTEWLSRQKKVPKNQNVIDMAYKNYQNRSIILNFSSVFFVIVQSAEKPYKITKSHSKCTVSLRGIPLERRGTQGIDYFTCILESMRDTNSGIFQSLKRVKIAEELTKLSNQVVKDQLVQYRLFDANLDREDTGEDKTVNNWIQFRPPLNNINVTLENTDVSELSTENMDEIKEMMLLLSLKGMENINSKINSSEVDNVLFDPIPLDNTCCKVQITDNFDYTSYFDDELTKINKSLQKLEENINTDQKNRTKVNFVIKNQREKIPRFDKEIVPENTDELNIDDLNVHIVTRGQNIGERHQYNENGICELSGESRLELQKQKMSVTDFNQYSDTFNKKKLFKALQGSEILENRMVLGLLMKDNKLIQENVYMKQFIETLNEVITEDSTPENKFERLNLLYDSLDEQIITEVDEFISFITVNDKSLEEYNEFLRNLGNFADLTNEMVAKRGEEVAKEKMANNKEKYLKRLLKQLKNTLNKIAFGRVSDPEKIKKNIPTRWKLTDSYKDKLVYNVDRAQRIVHDFKNKIDKSIGGENVFKSMAELVHKLTFNLDLITGRPHILDCDGNITYYSELTSKVSSQLLHYIFIVLLNNITSKSLTIDADTITRSSGKKISFRQDEGDTSAIDVSGDEEPETLEEVNAAAEKVGSDGGAGGPDETETRNDLEGFSIEIRESIKEREELVISFVGDFLKAVKRDYELIDKHTDSFINKTIAKISDEEKEQNLKFIEDLDKETRASFKVMLMTGLDSWKHLASKDKSLYFTEQIPEDNEVPVDTEEVDRANAANQLGISGEDLSEERFQEWKELRDRTLGESTQAFMDREVLPDDDGDYDNEHEGY
jgi:hypothetical protein